MAVLSDPDVNALYAECMREASRLGTPIPILKADLLAAFAAANIWWDANVASSNAALPQPARGALSARLKKRILVAVILRDWEVTP